MSRPNIGLSTVHRLLVDVSSGHNVSKAAAETVVDSLVLYLENAGEAAAAHLKIANRKTVTVAVARKVLSDKCLGISESDLIYSKGKQRGLPVAGVVRAFSHEGKAGKKKSSGLGFNISADAKPLITAAAEAYVKRLGVKALDVSKLMDAERKTIKERDVKTVLKLTS